MKIFSKKRRLILLCGTLGFLLYMGVFTHLFEDDFYSTFSYPLDEEISEFVSELREGRKLTHEPINGYNFSYIHNCKYKCANEDGPLRVVYIVKSALTNFQNRISIRNSWGFEKRFSDVAIRTVFVLGVDNSDLSLQEKINLESKQYGDILQVNFTDSYYNNTLKTMTAIKWAVSYCSNSKFYLFVDDDYYVSTRNLLQFLRNPVNYPAYLETPIDSVGDSVLPPQKSNDFKRGLLNISDDRSNLIQLQKQRKLLQVMDFELPEKVKLFSGNVFVTSPHRHYSSKWYVPLSEYPFHLWPPYITAGAYVVSKEVLISLYYGSLFTKHFRFDDIYLGIIAYKLHIEPLHCEEFYFYKKAYNAHNYHYVIASHGYGNPKELFEVWNEQRSIGNA